MYLRQPSSLNKSGFIYSACGSFTKSKERIQKFKEIGDSRYIHQNELDKACFNMTWLMEILKTWLEEQLLIKYCIDKAFNIAKNSKYDGCQCGLTSMVYKFFDKKNSGGTLKNENISNKELAEELHKPTIRKLEKRKVHSPFVDNIWGADLADMQLISKFNKGIRFLLCVIAIFSKYAWVIL